MVRTYIIVTRNQAPFNCAASGCAGVSPAVSVESNQNNRRGKIYVSSAGRGRDAHAPRGIRIYMAAAAVAAFIVLVLILNVGGKQGKPMIAEVEAVDTIKAMTVPIDTLRDKPSIDKLRNDNVEVSPTPSLKAKPKKQQKLPYTPPVPRHLIAQVAEANEVSEDSMAVALEEAERLINAMTVYQEIRISEICNVEYEEEYY